VLLAATPLVAQRASNGGGDLGEPHEVDSSLMVIDLTAPTAPPKIVELGAGNQRPHGLAFWADSASLLVTGERAQRVLVVNVDNGMIDSSMSTMQPATHMVSASRDYSRAFTTNITGMSVSAIDVPTRTVRATFQVGARIEGIAVTPDGKEVWVGGNESHLVYVLNGTTGEITHRLEGFGMAYRVGITPDGTTAVISDPGREKLHIAGAVITAGRRDVTRQRHGLRDAQSRGEGGRRRSAARRDREVPARRRWVRRRGLLADRGEVVRNSEQRTATANGNSWNTDRGGFHGSHR
jgi:DNA-binding beta-propeller fold protein YncE